LPDLLAHGPIGSFLSSIVNGAKKLSPNDALSIEGSFDKKTKGKQKGKQKDRHNDSLAWGMW